MHSSVLFVCLGNICRSPTAEGVFRTMAEADPRLKTMTVVIDSAGTGDWHVGAPPDPRAQQAAKNRGYNLSSIRARQVGVRDFSRFDYILAMDSENLNHLKQLAQGTDFNGHLGLFLDFADSPVSDVPDPYYGGVRGFETVLDLIEKASEGLIDHICVNR